MNERFFQVGDFFFRMQYEQELAIPGHFLLFEQKKEELKQRQIGMDPDSLYTYVVEEREELPPPSRPVLVQREDLLVCGERGGLETRYLGVKGSPDYYGYYQEISACKARIVLSPSRASFLNFDPVFSSLFALERRMIGLDALVLHSAYLYHQGEAILFSAPSGTGKSTQAGLWEQYRGSRTVNGDRSLLRPVDGRWMAGGWPVCGSSEICHNEDTPIRAIVMLDQGPDNRIRRLSPMQAFSLLYPQITINSWNMQATARAMDRIEALIGQIPVYHLSCTISEEAVRCLEEQLYG